MAASSRPVRRIAVAPALFVGFSLAQAVLAPSGFAQDPDVAALAEAKALGWAVGSAEAPVTVVEFTDVSCPRCASFHAGTRAELLGEFVEAGQVRWFTVTYVSGLFPNSEPLSAAAECAARQDRYKEFLASTYETRNAWIRAGAADVASAVERLADQTGLEPSLFRECLRDPVIQRRIDRVGELARELGVRGTPTWFVDGFLVMGDLPLGYARQFITARLPG